MSNFTFNKKREFKRNRQVQVAETPPVLPELVFKEEVKLVHGFLFPVKVYRPGVSSPRVYKEARPMGESSDDDSIASLFAEIAEMELNFFA
jgi:hypothetical protein